MGLSGFYKLLQKHGHVAVPVTKAMLYGKRVAIDGKQLVYKYAYCVDMGGDVVQETTRQISLLIERLLHTDGASQVIFVMDGKCIPKEKMPVLQNRATAKRKLQDRTDSLERSSKQQKTDGNSVPDKVLEQLDKMKRASRGVCSSDCTSIVQALEASGFDTYTSVEEADFALGWLARHDKVDYVISDDADLIVSGCSIVRGYPTLPLLYTPEAVSTALCVSADQLLELATLLKCDYVPGMRLYGPISALAGIKKFGTVEAILDNFSEQQKLKHVMPCATKAEYTAKLKRARELMSNYEPDAGALAIKMNL